MGYLKAEPYDRCQRPACMTCPSTNLRRNELKLTREYENIPYSAHTVKAMYDTIFMKNSDSLQFREYRIFYFCTNKSLSVFMSSLQSFARGISYDLHAPQ